MFTYLSVAATAVSVMTFLLTLVRDRVQVCRFVMIRGAVGDEYFMPGWLAEVCPRSCVPDR